MLNTMLIVDDEHSICLNLKRYFQAKGFNVEIAHDGKSALKLGQSMPMDIALVDLRLPDMSGLEVLKALKEASPGTAAIIITGHGDVETAVQAMQMKADNFVLKPIDLQVLEAVVDKCLEAFRAQAEVQYLKQKVSRLKGADQLEQLRQPQEVYHAIRLLAKNSSTTVLILGETGTGKGMIANTIHAMSDRSSHPLVDVNCAGLRSEFLESELFGHEKGAFTDAKSFKRGLLEIANRGSIFLDEIGEMSLPVQAKLLKVLEDRTFRRLGGTSNIEVDVRIITATNSNLERAVADNRFRKDLYFRLNVMPITLPPLRERREDILPLAGLFLAEFNQLLVKEIAGFSAAAESALVHYSWPGNIRELKNVIERGVLLCEGERIEEMHLPDNLRAASNGSAAKAEGDYNLASLEKRQIERTLRDCHGNHSQAARWLGIHRSTLIKKLKQYGFPS